MERIVKFENLEKEKMNAINRCMMDLFNYYETCATPGDRKNFRTFRELISAK